MANSLKENEERQGAGPGSNLDVNFPQHTSSVQGDAFKLLRTLNQYAEVVGPDDLTCRTAGVFKTVKVFESLFRNTLIALQFVTVLRRSSQEGEFLLKCHGWKLQQGLRASCVHTDKRSPSPRFFNKQGKGDSHKYSICVSRFPSAN